MTKSTITRDQLRALAVKKVESLKFAITQSAFTNIRRGLEEELQLAEFALAAMDSEPDCKERKLFCSTDTARMRKVISVSAGTEDAPLYRHAQPAPVVPDKMTAIVKDEAEYVEGWNACRAAMLNPDKARKKIRVIVLGASIGAGFDATASGYSPAQSDCCPAQNHVSPEQNGDTPAQSQGWIPVSEQMPPSRHEVLVGRWWGEKPRWCCKWATYIPGHPDSQSSGWLIPGASWTPTHWMPLPAAPQEVKGE